MQSGLHRGVYGRVLGPATDSASVAARLQRLGLKPVQSAHDGAVVGLAVDSCNRLLVSISLDGMLRVWDFKAMKVSVTQASNQFSF
jgi:WD40 repeat protein